MCLTFMFLVARTRLLVFSVPLPPPPPHLELLHWIRGAFVTHIPLFGRIDFQLCTYVCLCMLQGTQLSILCTMEFYNNFCVSLFRLFCSIVSFSRNFVLPKRIVWVQIYANCASNPTSSSSTSTRLSIHVSAQVKNNFRIVKYMVVFKGFAI